MRPSHLVVEVKDPLGEGEEKEEKQQQCSLPFFGNLEDDDTPR